MAKSFNPDAQELKGLVTHKSGSAGGMLVGNRHSEGGIKAVNKATNQPLEVEGGEVIITRPAVSDDTKKEFQGQLLTNREILSKINSDAGGVSFADGGEVATTGREYSYGGKVMKDYDIVSSCGCKHSKMEKGGKASDTQTIENGSEVRIYRSGIYNNKTGKVMAIMPDGKTFNIKLKNGEYAKFERDEIERIGDSHTDTEYVPASLMEKGGATEKGEKETIEKALNIFSIETGVSLKLSDFELEHKYEKTDYYKGITPRPDEIAKIQGAQDRLEGRHSGDLLIDKGNRDVRLEMIVNKDYLWSSDSKYSVSINFAKIGNGSKSTQNIMIYPYKNKQAKFDRGGKVSEGEKSAIEKAGKAALKTISELKAKGEFDESDIEGVCSMHAMELADDVAKNKSKSGGTTRDREYKKLYPRLKILVLNYVKKNTDKMEGGGQISKNDSLLNMVQNFIPSGYIGGRIYDLGYSEGLQYKTIDRVRTEMNNMLREHGDETYSISNLNKLIKDAAEQTLGKNNMSSASVGETHYEFGGETNDGKDIVLRDDGTWLEVNDSDINKALKPWHHGLTAYEQQEYNPQYESGGVTGKYYFRSDKFGSHLYAGKESCDIDITKGEDGFIATVEPTSKFYQEFRPDTFKTLALAKQYVLNEIKHDAHKYEDGGSIDTNKEYEPVNFPTENQSEESAKAWLNKVIKQEGRKKAERIVRYNLEGRNQYYRGNHNGDMWLSKAILKESYADGGSTDGISSAKTRASQGYEDAAWDEAKRNYGADWNNLSNFERQQIIDMETNEFDRSMNFASGGEIVLNEGNGKVINDLYKQWNAIKTDKQYRAWQDKVRDTKFGTYGTIPILEVLEKFEPKFRNIIEKKHFYKEIEYANGTYASGGEILAATKEINALKEKRNGYKKWSTPYTKIQKEIELKEQELRNMRGNQMEQGGSTEDGEVEVFVGGYPYYLTKIDITHLYSSNTKGKKGFPSHVAEFRNHDDETFYKDVAEWLKGKLDINGRSYTSFHGERSSFAEGGKVKEYIHSSDIDKFSEKIHGLYVISKLPNSKYLHTGDIAEFSRISNLIYREFLGEPTYDASSNKERFIANVSRYSKAPDRDFIMDSVSKYVSFKKDKPYEDGGEVGNYKYKVGQILTDSDERHSVNSKHFDFKRHYYVVVKQTADRSVTTQGDGTYHNAYWVDARIGTPDGKSTGSIRLDETELAPTELSDEQILGVIGNYEDLLKIQGNLGGKNKETMDTLRNIMSLYGVTNYGGSTYAEGGKLDDSDYEAVDSVKWVFPYKDNKEIVALRITVLNDSPAYGGVGLNETHLDLLTLEDNSRFLFSNWIKTDYFKRQPFYYTTSNINQYDANEIKDEVIRLLKEGNLDSIKKPDLKSSTLKYKKIFDKAATENKGGGISLSGNERAIFINYVDGFYGKNGVHAKDMPSGGFTKHQIAVALDKYLQGITKDKWGGGDSLDRERLRDILLGENKPATNKEEKSGKLKISDIPASVKAFMPVMQQKAIVGSEEHWDIIKEFEETIKKMPKTYGTEGTKKNDKIVWLHYFYGQSDWYVIEKDREPEQLQAFGYVILNGDLQDAELGYINIEELKATNKVELDFYWTPKKLGEVLADEDQVKGEREVEADIEREYEDGSEREDNSENILGTQPKYFGDKIIAALEHMVDDKKLTYEEIVNNLTSIDVFYKGQQFNIQDNHYLKKPQPTYTIFTKDGMHVATITDEQAPSISQLAIAISKELADYADVEIDETWDIQKGLKLKKALLEMSDSLKRIFNIKIITVYDLDARFTFNNGMQGALDLSRGADPNDYNPPARESLVEISKRLLKAVEEPKTKNMEGGKIKPEKIYIIDRRYFREYADANKAMRHFIDNKMGYDIPYEIVFEDGETLEGSIDVEGGVFDGNNSPFTWHIQTFYGNVANEPESEYSKPNALYKKDAVDFAKKIVAKYDLGEPVADSAIKASKAIAAPKPDINSAPAIDARMKSKKGQYEINAEIKALIKEKGTDRSKYSADELAMLKLYSGEGGLIKQGAASAGILDQFYTPDPIIAKMFGLTLKYGFKFQGANILEPSVGVGRFLQYIPKDSMVNKVVAYDTDTTAATICQLLYPNAEVKNASFETMFFQGRRNIGLAGLKEQFDLVIGNPPYRPYVSEYAPLGEKAATGALTMEMYFLMRGIDVLRAGGILCMVIPSSFMDNADAYNDFKEKLMDKADFLTAYRLPSGSFDRTDVTTDIIVLKRKDRATKEEEPVPAPSGKKAVVYGGVVNDKDDFGLPIGEVFIDGMTTMGQWGIMSPESFRKYGTGLGTGKGQQYQKNRQNGTWIKVGG